MRKKIFDGENSVTLDQVLLQLPGCEPIEHHLRYYSYGRRIDNYYHLDPEGVTASYVSVLTQNGILSPIESHAEIWIYGAEQNITKAEQRILVEMEKIKNHYLITSQI